MSFFERGRGCSVRIIFLPRVAADTAFSRILSRLEAPSKPNKGSSAIFHTVLLPECATECAMLFGLGTAT